MLFGTGKAAGALPRYCQSRVKPATFLLLLSIIICPLDLQADIRVALFQKELPKSVIVTSNTGLQLKDPVNNKIVFTQTGMVRLKLQKKGQRVFWSYNGKNTGKLVKIDVSSLEENKSLYLTTKKISGREYSGKLEVLATPEFLLVINIVKEEEYLCSVVANEMPVNWPAAALAAQAVVARTYMLKNLARHQVRKYDFCDLAHCQVYQGKEKISKAVIKAVKETRSLILRYQEKICDVYFHSTCGGRTAAVQSVWPQSTPLPYLQGQKENETGRAFCEPSPHFRWSISMALSEIECLLKGIKNNKLHSLQKLTIKKVDAAQRVQELKATYANGDLLLSGEIFYLNWGRKYGWHQLKSTKFQIETRKKKYLFVGQGLGHGVGMCQWGAYGRAQNGWGFRRILNHYFPGTQIKPATEPVHCFPPAIGHPASGR